MAGMRSRGVSRVLCARSVIDRAADVRERGTGEDPWSVRERMDCLDLSGFRGNPQRLGRNLQKLGALLRLSHGSIPSSAA